MQVEPFFFLEKSRNCFIYTLSNLMHKSPVLYIEQELISFYHWQEQVRGIPGCTAARTLCSHCWGPRFNVWSGNKHPTSHMVWPKRKKLKKNRGVSQPRDQTQVSHIAGRFFTSWATREAQIESTTSQFCIFLVINIKTLTYKLCLPTDADLITSVPLTASCLLWTRQKLSTLPLVTTSHFETVWNAHQDDC